MPTTLTGSLETLARVGGAAVGVMCADFNVSACFGAQHAHVQIEWGGGSAHLQVENRSHGALVRDLSLQDVRDFLVDLQTAVSSAPRPIEARITTRWSGTVIWHGTDEQGSFSGDLNWGTDEPEDDVLAQVAAMRPDLQRLIAERHNPGLAICRAFERLMGRHPVYFSVAT